MQYELAQTPNRCKGFSREEVLLIANKLIATVNAVGGIDLKLNESNLNKRIFESSTDYFWVVESEPVEGWKIIDREKFINIQINNFKLQVIPNAKAINILLRRLRIKIKEIKKV